MLETWSPRNRGLRNGRGCSQVPRHCVQSRTATNKETIQSVCTDCQLWLIISEQHTHHTITDNPTDDYT